MIQVYKKNNLFIIEDTCRDVIYPNLTKDEAIAKLKEFNRESDRIDYPITDIREDKFKYVSLEANEAYLKELEQRLVDKDKKIDELEQELAFYNEEVKDRGTCGLCKKLENKEINELRQQLAEKDAELLQKEKIIQDLMLCEFVVTTLDFNKLSADNCKLREQLAEKEEEIERLKYQLLYSQVQTPKEEIDKFNMTMTIQSLDYTSQIRHQICNEIREKADKRNSLYKDNSLAYVINEIILDQVEKGEGK